MNNLQSVDEEFGKYIIDAFDKMHLYLANLKTIA